MLNEQRTSRAGAHNWNVARDPEPGVTEELRSLEPIFHRVEAGSGREAFEAIASPDFLEVGASGQVYDRDFVLDTLARRHSQPHDDRWQIHDFEARELSDDLWLVTYELDQDGRRSRRATIWRRTESGWMAEYHQGTLLPPTPEPPIPDRGV